MNVKHPMTSEAVPGVPETALEPPARPRRRRWRHAAVAGGAVLLLSGSAGGWFLFEGGSGRWLEEISAKAVASERNRTPTPPRPAPHAGAGGRERSVHALQDSLWWAREYDASIEASLRILAIDPSDTQAYYSLGYAHGMMGRNREAIGAFRTAVRLSPDDSNLVALAWGYARAGERRAAYRTLGRVHGQDALLREVATVYGELGEPDRAFTYLDRAYALDPASLESLRTDPAADALRSDPRFAWLLERLNSNRTRRGIAA